MSSWSTSEETGGGDNYSDNNRGDSGIGNTENQDTTTNDRNRPGQIPGLHSGTSDSGTRKRQIFFSLNH